MNSISHKVYLETFGCQMNVSDSERVKTNLAADGFEIVADESAADVILINTCSVREKAEQKLFDKIGRIRARRNINQPVIGVMGCVAQLEGDNLLGKTSRIDFVAGTKATGRIGGMIRRHFAAATKAADLGEREFNYDWNVNPIYKHSPHVSFVPIIEGCNKFCTYCIVPFARGREVSRPAAEIIAEVKRLRESGVREVHLIGQNVNSYRPREIAGLEGAAGATPFVKLLRAVAATGIERLKFTTSFPRDFHRDIVTAIEEHENLCNWVHLPVQSGSDRILRLMRRGHQIEQYRRHVASIKSAARAISLTSDVIVGFPGETRADFLETKRLVAESEFDSLYIFKYSPRPGTPAAALVEEIDESEKQERFIELEAAQRINQRVIFANTVGRRLQVLAERRNSKNSADLTGHSTCHKVVNFAADHRSPGEILEIEITAAKNNSLYGKIL